MPKSRYLFYYNHLVCETLILSRDVQTIMQLPQLQGVICTASTGRSQTSPRNILYKAPTNLSTSTASGSQSAILTQGALQVITGQKAKISRGKKSIAAFNLSKGGVVGCMVTLRRLRFYLFLDQIITLILPNSVDFSLNKSTFGKNTFLEFSQLEPFFAQFENTRGLNVNILVDTKKMKYSAQVKKGEEFFRDLL